MHACTAAQLAGTNLPRTTATAAVIAAAIPDHAIIPEPQGLMSTAAAATTTALVLAVLKLVAATAVCTSSRRIVHPRLQVFEGEQQPACCALLRTLQPSAISPAGTATSSRVQREPEHVLNLLLLLLMLVLLLLLVVLLMLRRRHAKLAKREPGSSVLRRHP